VKESLPKKKRRLMSAKLGRNKPQESLPKTNLNSTSGTLSQSLLTLHPVSKPIRPLSSKTHKLADHFTSNKLKNRLEESYSLLKAEQASPHRPKDLRVVVRLRSKLEETNEKTRRLFEEPHVQSRPRTARKRRDKKSLYAQSIQTQMEQIQQMRRRGK